MTEHDKQEIAAIVSAAVAGAVKEAMSEHGHCALGIKPETAHELISFADTWKHARRTLIGGIIGVALVGALGALWVGFKAMLK